MDSHQSLAQQKKEIEFRIKQLKSEREMLDKESTKVFSIFTEITSLRTEAYKIQQRMIDEWICLIKLYKQKENAK